MRRPNREDISKSFHEYFDLTQGDDLFEILKETHASSNDFLETMALDKIEYRYAPDKWSLKEVVVHLVSAEIYFCDLALRVTADDSPEPMSYPLEKYKMSENSDKSMEQVLKDFGRARVATIEFLGSFDQTLFEKVQHINENHYSPVGIGFIIAGHEIHHMNIIKERYLSDYEVGESK